MSSGRIALVGASGHLGSAIKDAFASTTFAIEPFGRRELAEAGSAEDQDSLCGVIDASLPEALPLSLALAQRHSVPFLSGVTNYTQEHKEVLVSAGKDIPVLWLVNFAPSLPAFFALARSLAARLPEGGCTLHETHRLGKRDVPSGTAEMLKDLLGDKVDTVVSTRTGVSVGDAKTYTPPRHELHWQVNHETLSLAHSVDDFAAYGTGALHAWQWILSKETGFFSTEDYCSEHPDF